MMRASWQPRPKPLSKNWPSWWYPFGGAGGSGSEAMRCQVKAGLIRFHTQASLSLSRASSREIGRPAPSPVELFDFGMRAMPTSSQLLGHSWWRRNRFISMRQTRRCCVPMARRCPKARPVQPGEESDFCCRRRLS